VPIAFVRWHSLDGRAIRVKWNVGHRLNVPQDLIDGDGSMSFRPCCAEPRQNDETVDAELPVALDDGSVEAINWRHGDLERAKLGGTVLLFGRLAKRVDILTRLLGRDSKAVPAVGHRERATNGRPATAAHDDRGDGRWIGRGYAFTFENDASRRRVADAPSSTPLVARECSPPSARRAASSGHRAPRTPARGTRRRRRR
jgi:hypothetical protein